MRPHLPFLLVFLALLHSAAAACVPRSLPHHLLPHVEESTSPEHEHRSPHRPAPDDDIKHSPKGSQPAAPQVFHDIHEALVQLCGRTDYPDVCISSIKPLLPGVVSVDLGVLLGLEIKALRAKTKETQAKIHELYRKPGKGSRLASILQDCHDSYEDAKDDLESAAQAVASRDKGTADTMLSAVISDAETCEDGYVDAHLPSPTKEMSHEVEKLASNCLAFRSSMPWP